MQSKELILRKGMSKGDFTKGVIVIAFTMFLVFSANSQSVSGYVIDEVSERSIPFVNIAIQGTTVGTTSDIDGFFRLSPNQFPVELHFHSLGYFDTVITFQSGQDFIVPMREKTTQLKEAIILADVNPALAIIQKAIDNRSVNNPEKNYSFTYKTYSKMIFGPEVGINDDDIVLTESSDISDSNNYEFQQAMKRHYFFITESVTERKHIPPNHSFENVIANRFSGLSNPAFAMIASDFQPFSYYSDYVDIVGIKYLSPLANNSYKNYVFVLQDSVFNPNDTVYTIYFQPKNGQHFNGLIGTMSISTNKYAIKNIKVKQANPTSSMQVSLEQMSEFIDGKQWFPVQFNTHIIMKMANSSSSGGVEMDFFNAKGKTYVKNIKVGVELSKKDFPNVALELSEGANEQTEEFWNSQRKKPLTGKEENTYVVIDSLGEKFNFDKKMLVLEALATGLIPMGSVSVEVNKLVDYNEFEGVRLGLGLRTNDKISKWVSVGAYAAYGFNDVHWKYGGDIKFKIYPKNDIEAGVKYMNDVTPSGGNKFYKRSAFELRSYSDLYITRMDKVEGYQGYVSFRMFKDFQNKLFYNSYSQSHNYPFAYAPEGDTDLSNQNSFQRAEVGYTFRFGYKEKYIRTFNQNVSLGTKYPYVWMRLAHGNKELGGTYDYTKLDARISKTYLIKGFGKFGFQLDAGTIMGDVPSTLLHYGRGMKVHGFNLYIENAFNTMGPNEFISQHYASAHIHHSFGPLYRNQYSALELSVVSSAGWGTIDHTDAYLGHSSKTMEKGFFESGLLFDNLLAAPTYGIGLGVFYRYGPYALPEVKDNFGFSFTILYVMQ